MAFLRRKTKSEPGEEFIDSAAEHINQPSQESSPAQATTTQEALMPSNEQLNPDCKLVLSYRHFAGKQDASKRFVSVVYLDPVSGATFDTMGDFTKPEFPDALPCPCLASVSIRMEPRRDGTVSLRPTSVNLMSDKIDLQSILSKVPTPHK